MSPKEIMKSGSELLGEYLYPNGFKFEIVEEGRGSGGNFVQAEFQKSNLKLELHFRHSLGIVKYHCKTNPVSHENYMRALGVIDQCQYPGFSSNDPIDGFRHLKHDLEKFGSDFVSGNHSSLLRAAKAEQTHEAQVNKKLQAAYEGDDRKRKKAKQYFTQKEYQKCVSEFQCVKYPELLTNSEKKILDIAKRRLKIT